MTDNEFRITKEKVGRKLDVGATVANLESRPEHQRKERDL